MHFLCLAHYWYWYGWVSEHRLSSLRQRKTPSNTEELQVCNPYCVLILQNCTGGSTSFAPKAASVACRQHLQTWGAELCIHSKASSNPALQNYSKMPCVCKRGAKIRLSKIINSSKWNSQCSCSRVHSAICRDPFSPWWKPSRKHTSCYGRIGTALYRCGFTVEFFLKSIFALVFACSNAVFKKGTLYSLCWH